MTKLHRIWGPPGCGKTTYLTQQAERASHIYGRKGVLIASLTKAAAAEAAGRVDLDASQVGTLHAHAFRALGHPTLAEAGPLVKEWNKQAAHGWKASAKNPDAASPDDAFGEPGADEVFATYMRNRTAMLDRTYWGATVKAFATRWEDFKAQNNALDFTDLIEQATTETETAPGKPAVILLDEAQDLSALEMRLADAWTEQAEQVVIVGDPDQCLYKWRGSDPAVFAQGEAAFEHVLSQSYRVPRAVHERAVRLIERVEGRKPILYYPRDEEGYVKRSAASIGTDDGIERLANELVRADGTSMLLAPCAYQLTGVINELKRRGEPFHNPYRVTNGQWNPLRAGRRILALYAWRAPEDGGQARPWTIDEVWAWLEPLQAQGFLQKGIKDYTENLRQTARLGDGGGEREFPPGGLATIFENPEDLRRATDGDLDWYRSHLLGSWKTKLDYAIKVAERSGVNALRKEPTITIGTIHSVKGGEADDVWVVPDLSAAGWESWADRGGDGRPSVIRLYYVAMTRARVGLHLVSKSSDRALTWAT